MHHNLSLVIFYVQRTTMSHNTTIASADELFFQHYDNLDHLDLEELTQREKGILTHVLDVANNFRKEYVGDVFSRAHFNFFAYHVRDHTLRLALFELKKNKENCNWDLHTRCTRSFLKYHHGYVDPPDHNEDLLERLIHVRTLIMLFPCHLAFVTLDRVVEQHNDLIGKGDELVPDFHKKYLADGGWCSMEDYDDEIWDAWDWFKEWTYDTIISVCVEFNDEILRTKARGDDKAKDNGGTTFGCPSSTRREEIKEENAALAEWRNMHKNDAVLQQLIDMRKNGVWVRARDNVNTLGNECVRWKHVVRLMPSPLAFQALEDVMKIHENFLGMETKLERYKKRGGWMSKKDFDEKTMAAWIRVQVLESRFRNVHVHECNAF